MKSLKSRIIERVMYQITSKKFWAWCVATILRIVNVIDVWTWLIVTLTYIGVESGQNIFELLIKKGRK
jgi:hypothetical protein